MTEEMSELTAKQMFIDMFFWVAENRPSWLEECITRKKAELQLSETEKEKASL